MCNRRTEFPNLCLIASIVLSISGSNSAVERSFSILTLMLSDRRLSTSNKVLDDLMIIKGNAHNWSSSEYTEIIENALKAYMEKRRSVALLDDSVKNCESDDTIAHLNESCEPAEKVRILDVVLPGDDSSSADMSCG